MCEDNELRRTFIKSTGALIAGFGMSGTALAKVGEESKEESTPEISVLAKDGNSALFKISYGNQVSVHQISEAQNGRVIKMPVGNESDIVSISAQSTGAVQIRRYGPTSTTVETQDVISQGWEVIERSKGNRRLPD